MESNPVTLLGDVDLSKWIEAAKEIIHEAVVEGVKTQAEQVVETAKELVPVDTGALRDNIQAQISAGGHYAIVKVVTKEIPYGYMVHFGTEKMTGRPFLYQAAERCGAAFPQQIKDAIKTGDPEEEA